MNNPHPPINHCFVAGCTNPAPLGRSCSTHYQRFRRTGSFERYGGRSADLHCETCGTAIHVERNQARRNEGRFCSYECKYEADRGVERVTGTRYVRQDGYVAVKVGIRQYQLEHRLVMEQAIGRSLETNEHVHHVNGDRSDNRFENLQLMSNEDHQRLHDHLGVMAGPTRIDMVCQNCGGAYTTKPSRAATSKYCSRACQVQGVHAGNVGKKYRKHKQ